MLSTTTNFISPVTHASYFGHTDPLQALNALHLKFKIKCIYFENVLSHNMYKSLFLLQPTIAQICITIFSLYIMFTPTCFDTSVSSSGSFKTCTSLSYVSS